MKFKSLLTRFGVESPPSTVTESALQQVETPRTDLQPTEQPGKEGRRELSPAEADFRDKMKKFLEKIGGYIQVNGVKNTLTGNRIIYGVYVPNEHRARAVEYFKAKGYAYENEASPEDAAQPSLGRFNTNITEAETLIRISYKES